LQEKKSNPKRGAAEQKKGLFPIAVRSPARQEQQDCLQKKKKGTHRTGRKQKKKHVERKMETNPKYRKKGGGGGGGAGGFKRFIKNSQGNGPKTDFKKTNKGGRGQGGLGVVHTPQANRDRGPDFIQKKGLR